MNRRSIGTAVLCAAILVLALSATPASALQRTNTYNFGLDGTAGNSFTNEPTSAAFDQTNNKLYANHVLVGMIGWSVPTPGTFTPLTAPFPIGPGPGTAAATLGIAIDNNGGATDGRIYRMMNAGALEAYNPDGTPVGAPFPIAIPTPRILCGVAVDSAGNVFFANANATVTAEGKGLRRYTSAGAELPPINTSAYPGNPCRLAFDAADNLYVATSTATGQVWKYTKASDYTSATQFDAFPANGVAVNKSTGRVFIAHPERVTEYDTSGNLIREFGNEIGVSATKRYLGVAVDEATDEVYVTDSNTAAAQRRIKVYGPPTVVTPEAVTNPATGVTRKEATVHGEVDPAGGADITECRFQWGPTTAYANSASCVPAASVGTPITTATAVSAVLPTASLQPQTTYHFRVLAKNSEGKTTVGANRSFTTLPAVFETVTGAATNITENSVTLNGSFNADSISTTYYFEYGPTTTYGTKFPLPAPPGAPGGNAPVSEPVSQNITGLEPSTSPNGKLYNYRIVAVNSFGTTFGLNQTFTTLPAVKSLATLPATNIKKNSVTLNGTFDPAGVPTKYYFEYGTSIGYGSYAPLPPPGEEGGATFGSKNVSATIGGLFAGSTYHYRMVAVNIYGTTAGADFVVVPNEEPTISFDIATEVNTDGAVLRALVNPNALDTTYRFEYGTEDCSVIECTKGPDVEIGDDNEDVPVSFGLTGLIPNSTYHFRVVATNSRGTTTGSDHFFITFALDSGIENCPNVLVRKQTGASVAPKCRAYELVSSHDSGGYDVSSNLIPGLDPMPGYPRADEKVLYTLNHGALPGSGNPTNLGGDPYVASRGPDRWTTEYVGLQADQMPSLAPYASTLLGTDEGLGVFAFGGPKACAPCFPDGSTNIPLRLPGGALVQGMVGSESPGPANPTGKVLEPLSADGSHLVFGSTTKLEPGGNAGSLTIYDRDLRTGDTQVASTLPNGSTMPAAGVAELDISADGSRILIGRLAGTDPAGNESHDLFMHVGDSPNSVQVLDSGGGALYAGMSRDGSEVYFSTADPVAGDGDAGRDLFRADVTPAAATVSRVSTGTEGTGNSNACSPVPNSAGNHWNAVGMASPADCGVVAIAGGGGISEESGAAYFLSPEQLDGAGNGTLNQPNLYVAAPGSPPDYVATIDPDNPLIRHAVNDAGVRDSADFQVTPDGGHAVFATEIPLTGAASGGHVEIFRATTGGGIACVSCAPTNGTPSTDTSLTTDAMNLIDDGRVFYTSAEQLVLRDTNQVNDVYEWDAGTIGLVSTGLDPNDSGLLTASADGVDVFFFTRELLSPQDGNGGAMKIYDAREGGGYLFNPPPRDCVASDECHGPGTVSPPPPPVNTYEGTEEPQPEIAEPRKTRCKKGFVKKRGKCVRKKPKRSHNRTRRASR